MPLSLYSTASRSKTVFTPRDPGRVRVYVCGPTVYDACHVGHARPAVVFDTIRRHLEYRGYPVVFISNITDIDDKILRRAEREGVSFARVASRWQDEYERDMAELGVRSPTVRPKASEHIPETLAIVRGLMDQGFAYATPRGVWFDVSKFPRYGQVSGRSRDDDETEHRVERDPDKRNPQDFALWKAARPGEPSWPSPWGAGRPGWHIECSAMAARYADGELDIHGGGADLMFPHHENEAAQSEAFSGKPLARYWMHNGFITVGQDDKMGKSKGNAFTLREAFALAPPAAMRLWILGTHYRMPLAYRPEFLTAAAAALERLSRAGTALRTATDAALADADASASRAAPDGSDAGWVREAAEAEEAFAAAMDDDFNTPRALAAAHGLAGRVHAALAERAGRAGILALWSTWQAVMGVLGLPLTGAPSAAKAGDADGLVELLVAIRGEARTAGNFALSDRVRDGLAELDIELADARGRTTWKRRERR